MFPEVLELGVGPRRKGLVHGNGTINRWLVFIKECVHDHESSASCLFSFPVTAEVVCGSEQMWLSSLSLPSTQNHEPKDTFFLCRVSSSMY